MLATALRLYIAGRLGLGDDEAYYWEWSQHLDWSYLDHPPLTAWLIGIACRAFGQTELAVRSVAVGCSAAFSVVLFLLARRLLASGWRALIAVLLVTAMPIFGVGAIIVAPDAPLALCWVAATFLFTQVVYRKSRACWYGIGVCIGFGLLSKYNMVLWPCCAACYFALARADRFWLRRKEPYLALLIGLALFFPVIYWNARHGWASLAFHLVERNRAPVAWSAVVAAAAGQLLYFSPLVIAGVVAGLAVVGRRALRDRQPTDLLVVAFSIPYLIFFGLVSLVCATAKPHWPALGYVGGTIALVAALPPSAIVANARHRFLPALFWCALTTAAVTTIALHVHVLYPILQQAAVPDPTNDLFGWREAALVVNQELADLQQSGPTVVATTRYNLASPLTFYLGGRIAVLSIGDRTEQHDFWQRGSLSSTAAVNVLAVASDRFPENLCARYRFEQAERLPPIEIVRGGRVIRTFFVYRCRALAGSAASLSDPRKPRSVTSSIAALW